ncbi:hypothetical protein D3C85_1924440 [compost metagenome]
MLRHLRIGAGQGTTMNAPTELTAFPGLAAARRPGMLNLLFRGLICLPMPVAGSAWS